METRRVKEITQNIADTAERSAKPYLIEDLSIPQFFLKVGARKKSWIVRRKFQGTTRTLTIGSFPATNAKDIRPFARKYLSDLETGTHPKEKARQIRRAAEEKRASSKWTLSLAFDWYLAGQDEKSAERLEKALPGAEPCPRKTPLAETTLKSYKAARERFVSAGTGKTPLADLTGEGLMKAHDSMIRAMNPKRAKAGGATQAAQAMRCGRAVVRAALPVFLPTVKDPFADIPRGRKWDEPAPRNRTIIERENSLKKWWDAVEALRRKEDGRAKDAAAIADWLQITLLFGCRRSETQEMTWDQIDFEDGVASFDKTKSKRPHAVPFGPHARSILERRKKAVDEIGGDSPFVFPASRTGYKTKTRTSLRQTKAAEMEVSKASGVDFTAHDLRRTFSTLLGEAGTNVYQIKAAMNHAAGQDVTERHYMRIRLKALRSVFERLEDAILEEAGVTREKDGAASIAEAIRKADPATIEKIKMALSLS